MLSAGMQIGPFELISPLGAGGMGEVYRARDSRLGRDVAIKVLPTDFSADVDRLRRLEQEARAAGMLNHPNILTIFEIGTNEGAPYIVSELLDGEELRAKLKEGPLPLRKALNYAQQIASGLAAAHSKRIVHRDLKPENLFVTKDGIVKILDFGLAKLKPVEPGGVADSQSPTMRRLTKPGVVMGTVAYMSPEQVRGQEADHRADIFAFGLILYEMLSGKRAFRGASMADLMSAILKEEPPELSESNAKVSPALEKIVRRCLEKDPEQRFHSAHDLGLALEAVSAPSGSHLDPTTMSAVTEFQTTGKSRLFANPRTWIFVTVLLLVALLASLPFMFSLFRRKAPEESSTVRFNIALPEKAVVFGPAVSPDGRTLVFTAVLDGKTQLWMRPLGAFTARALPGTEGVAGMAFWSPDSRWIGFLAGDQLHKFDLKDGTHHTLCNVPGAGGDFGGTWSREDTILFGRTPGNMSRVPAAGGEPATVWEPEALGQAVLRKYPHFLPDSRHYFYLAPARQQAPSEIYLASLDNRETTRLLAADSQAVYATSAGSSVSGASGYLVFARDGLLLAQPFDASKLKLSGEPFRIADPVKTNAGIRRGEFGVSDTGILVYDPMGKEHEHRQLTWFDRAGNQLGTVGSAGPLQRLALSPDEKLVAVEQVDGKTATRDIFVKDLARDTTSRLTFDAADDVYPVWSPDGRRIAWRSNRKGSYQIYQKQASGAGEEELLLESNNEITPTDWSADGKFILYRNVDPQTRQDIWVLPLQGDRKPIPFLQTPFDEGGATFSPEARWVAYQSNESGRGEVYLQTFPVSAGKWPVSTQGGSLPIWRRDGKELFYLSGDGKLMAVAVETRGTHEPGIPKVLFDIGAMRRVAPGYGVAADGQRILLGSQISETAPSSLAVVVNWTADLKR